MDGNFLRVKIDHSQPVELAIFSDSMFALSALFARYADKNGFNINEDTARLYVHRVAEGSIVLDLVDQAKNLVMLGEGIDNIFKFAGYLYDAIDYFKGKKDAPTEKIENKDIEYMDRMLEPIALDQKAALSFHNCSGVNIIQNYNISAEDANAAQNKMRRLRRETKLPVNGRHDRQLLYFFQARDSSKKGAGNKSVIENISRKPVNTVFSNDEIKEAILTEALFTKAYVVDVDVQTIDDEPKLYNILYLHESIDRNEG